VMAAASINKIVCFSLVNMSFVASCSNYELVKVKERLYFVPGPSWTSSASLLLTPACFHFLNL
jgi:hypothetical protein